VLVSLVPPTKPMRAEAARTGYYEAEAWGKRYRKVQLLTIEELLDGKEVDCPPMRRDEKTLFDEAA